MDLSRVMTLTLGTALLGLVPAAHAHDALEAMKDGVVEVRAGQKTGSGFIVSIAERHLHILTAYHVVEGESEIGVRLLRDPGRTLPARVIENQVDLGDQGLSLLRLEIDDRRGLVALPLSQRAEPDSREPVFAAGFYGAGRIPWSLTQGRLIGEAEGSLLFTGAIAEGNSGGPLLQDGEVVGVVTARGREHHLATPARLAQYFAEKVVGVLPVRCNVPLQPDKPCREQIAIDRLACDYIRSANRLYLDGEYDAAVAEYDRAIAYRDDLAVLHNNRGVIRMTKGEFEPAEADFESALERDPDYAVAEINRLFASRVYSPYFASLESVRPGGDPQPNPFVENLRGLFSGSGSETGADDRAPFAGAIEAMSSFAESYSEMQKLEALIKSLHEGKTACYGGDLVGANDELTTAWVDGLIGRIREMRR